MLKLTIEENDAGQRLDRFLRKYLRNAPLSAIYRMIRKDVKVNGKRAREDRMLEAGDELALYLPEEEVREFAKARKAPAAKRQFGIAYEDEGILIVDKPSGLLTHGDSREKKNTLTNQVCGYLQQEGAYDPAREKSFRPAPANRLDRNTSGLVMFGKDAASARLLAKLLRERDGVRKYYRTIVCGRLEEEVLISQALTKDEEKNRMRVVDPSDEDAAEAGKGSVSRVIPVKAGDDFSIVEVELLTGRTHQIRVHLAHVGHPLAADPKYGDPRVNRELKKQDITTQLLHACRLEFADSPEVPEGLAKKTVKAKTPAAFRKAEELLMGR